MTSLKYEKIFERFLGKITDYDFLTLNIDDSYSLMTEKLMSTLSNPYIRRLFSSLSVNNDIQELRFEMEHSVDEFTDEYFVTEMLAKGIVIEWLQPQVKSKLLTAQMFSGKEQKFYAQSNQLSEMRSLLEDTQLELRQMIRDRGYIYNSYLEES